MGLLLLACLSTLFVVLVLLQLKFNLFLQVLVLYFAHELMEIAFSFLVGDEVVKDSALKIDFGTLLSENSLYFLEHVEDVVGGHAAIVVIVAELKQELQLLVVVGPSKEVDGEHKVQEVRHHLVDDVGFTFDPFESERLEPVKKCLDHSWRYLRLFKVFLKQFGKLRVVNFHFKGCVLIFKSCRHILDCFRIKLRLKMFDLQVGWHGIDGIAQGPTG